MAEHLSKHKDHFTLFLETGFIAVNQSDEESALRLFKAAEMLNAASTLPKIGVGYLHLCKLELKQAAELFRTVLDTEPANEMAKTFLGITLSMTPDKGMEGEKMLTQTAKSSSKEVKNLSDTALDFVDRFVKKPISPADLQAKPEQKK